NRRGRRDRRPAVLAMPIITDGNGRRTVLDRTPERDEGAIDRAVAGAKAEQEAYSPTSSESRQRGADANRALHEARRAAAPAHHNVGVFARNEGHGQHWARKRAAKLPAIAAALRTTATIADAASQVGMSKDALSNLIGQYRADGTLPADVDELLRTRAQ